jgi:hypothetical protein
MELVLCRKAISAAYYAVFHALCECCADCVIGDSDEARRIEGWLLVYRAVDHGHARKISDSKEVASIGGQVVTFAQAFIYLQTLRHDVDYNPRNEVDFWDVASAIGEANRALDALAVAPQADRRAFAALMLVRARRA